VANPTPQQQALRDRVERLIALAAPALDLVLAAGDRLSRILGPEDEYYPVRSAGEAFELDPPASASPPESGSSADDA
jgi:hypothetical protein